MKTASKFLILSLVIVAGFFGCKAPGSKPGGDTTSDALKRGVLRREKLSQPASAATITTIANAQNEQAIIAIDSGVVYQNSTARKSVDSAKNAENARFIADLGKINFSSPVNPPPVDTSVTYTSSAVISLNGASSKTISKLKITGGSTPCITLTNCHDIHITKSYLQNSKTVGVLLTNCYNITIDYNFITNVSTGVYATDSNGGGIVVNYNQFLNMKGPFPRGQFVQFNTVSGAGLSISYNKGENILGSSYPEDAINIYMSNGTSASPIQIVGNWIRGGGPSRSGGGIMTGDYGGSYQYVANNILVDPGQYGLGIAGGHDITFMNNKVYARAQSFTNVGVVVWTQGGVPAIKNATVGGNHINYTSGSTSDGNFLNPYWIGNVNGVKDATPALWSTNVWNDKTITAAILPVKIITMQ